jgi:hypothetical protein
MYLRKKSQSHAQNINNPCQNSPKHMLSLDHVFWWILERICSILIYVFEEKIPLTCHAQNINNPFQNSFKRTKTHAKLRACVLVNFGKDLFYFGRVKHIFLTYNNVSMSANLYDLFNIKRNINLYYVIFVTSPSRCRAPGNSSCLWVPKSDIHIPDIISCWLAPFRRS